MTVAQMIEEARIKRHAIATGTAVVEIDTGDYRTKFKATTVEEIDAYIARLQAELADPVQPTRGAIGFVF